MNEMPEAVHIPAPSELLASQGTVNLLALGAKNDGSEDISPIVNQYTAQYMLYLPPGLYKVSHPLMLKNSLFGAGYSRTSRTDANQTWLLSEIEHEDVTEDGETGVINFGASDIAGQYTIYNLNIRCHSHECGIRIAPCLQPCHVLLDSVGIYNVRGYGVMATRCGIPGFASRPLFLRNMTIFGTKDWPTPSIGIYIGSGMGDNRLSDIEIMATRIGIWQELTSFTYASNIHLWSGCFAGHDRDNWWETTRCLVLGGAEAHFIGSNVYMDTAWALVEFRSRRNTLSLTNFMFWEDDSTVGCERNDARIFLLGEGINGDPAIHLQGGLIGLAGNDSQPGKLTDLTAPVADARIHDVRILCDYSVSAKNWRCMSFLEEDTPAYGFRYEAAEKEQTVLVAAIVAEAENGCCSLIMTDNTGAMAEFEFIKENGVLTAQTVRSRRTDNRLQIEAENNRFVKIWIKVPAGIRYDVNVKTLYASRLLFPLDLALTRNRTDYAWKTEIQ